MSVFWRSRSLAGRVEVERAGGAVGSGCGSVLVDEPVAGGGALDRVAWPDGDDIVVVVWCSLIDAPVGSMRVVVLDVFLEQLL